MANEVKRYMAMDQHVIMEYYDNNGVITIANESQVIDNRIWTTSTTYTSPIIYISNDRLNWELPKDCLICHKQHMWIMQGQEPDHKYITDNLEYLEYQCEKKGML